MLNVFNMSATLPDVRRVGGHVIFGARVEVFFCPQHGRGHAAVVHPQGPPVGVVGGRICASTEHAPAPLQSTCKVSRVENLPVKEKIESFRPKKLSHWWN